MDQIKIGIFLKELRKEKKTDAGAVGREVKCIRQDGISLGNGKQYA